MPKSSIIIPVFNQAALTQQCLQALFEQTIGEVIVVDDGSTDATPQILESFRDRIRVIRHSENKGFAAACNDGAAEASSPYLVFLNNDTIPEPGWLEALEHYADGHPRAAVVGSKLLYPDRRVQHAGVVVCQDRYPRHLYSGFPADYPAVARSRQFQIVTGACMLVRRGVFEEAQGFDPLFRNGFEDVDLCLRLGAIGQEIHYCAESVLLHYESVSPGRFKWDGANVALYRQRWFERVQPDDLSYYLNDGLMRLRYEGRYPFALEISPLLAFVEADGRLAQTEQRLKQLAANVAELSRENARLSLELGKNDSGSERLRYRDLRRRVREVVQKSTPPGATVLIITKGDSLLLDLPQRRGWHFPRTEGGAYAGHHPASSEQAITELEALRERGADYLLIPEPSFWWLDHYQEFRHHCETHYVRLCGLEDACVIYGLDSLPKNKALSCEEQRSE